MMNVYVLNLSYDNGHDMHAVGVFSTRELAEKYTLYKGYHIRSDVEVEIEVFSIDALDET